MFCLLLLLIYYVRNTFSPLSIFPDMEPEPSTLDSAVDSVPSVNKCPPNAPPGKSAQLHNWNKICGHVLRCRVGCHGVISFVVFAFCFFITSHVLGQHKWRAS